MRPYSPTINTHIPQTKRFSKESNQGFGADEKKVHLPYAKVEELLMKEGRQRATEKMPAFNANNTFPCAQLAAA